jgi:hypothetical protein
MTMGYWVMTRVGFPVVARDFSLLHSVETGSMAYPVFYPMGVGDKSVGAWSLPLTPI